jgi:hypothetical protein
MHFEKPVKKSQWSCPYIYIFSKSLPLTDKIQTELIIPTPFDKACRLRKGFFVNLCSIEKIAEREKCGLENDKVWES